MSNLIIPRLQPKDSINFVLTGEIFGEVARSKSFKINVPPACPLINKAEIKLSVSPGSYQLITGSNKQFSLAGFRKISHPTNNSFYLLRVRLSQDKDRGTLKKGDEAKIFTSGTTGLNNINNRGFTIFASGLSTTGNSWVVDLQIPNSFSISVTSGTFNSGAYIQEGSIKAETKVFTVSLPQEEVFSQLVDKKKPLVGVATIAVRDVPIYAFKNFEKQNTSEINRQLLYNLSTLTDESEPPTYTSAMANAYLAGSSYSKQLRCDEKRNFIFYVSIARYIYRDSKWTGQWLQKNTAGRPIWGKAVVKR